MRGTPCHTTELSQEFGDSTTTCCRSRTLQLAGNALSGSIPSFITRMTRLGFLDVSSNAFTGNLPASMSALVTVGYGVAGHGAVFSFACRVRLIPAVVGTGCRTIDFSGNQLNGTSVASLQSLGHLQYVGA